MTPHPINLITVRDAATAGNLAVFPLFLSQTGGPDYVASSVAMERHGLQVTEVSQGGSVPDLMVVNPSDVCVLLLDGEELRGARQNRVINTTILLGPRSKTTIPVSCTEQGRWHYTSATFQSAKSVMPVAARMRKTRSVSHSLEAAKQYMSNQGEVWQGVAELHQKVGSHSPTGAMADAYEQMRRDMDDVIARLPAAEAQCGLIAFIGGKPAGMDLVSRPGVYRDLHPQLLQSYAMEALANLRDQLRRGKAAAAAPAPQALAAKAFLERCAAVHGKPFKSVGMGTDWRFLDGAIVGSGLEHQATWVHMAYFVDEPEAATDDGELRRRMSRMSQRSHYRRQEPGQPGAAQ